MKFQFLFALCVNVLIDLYIYLQLLYIFHNRVVHAGVMSCERTCTTAKRRPNLFKIVRPCVCAYVCVCLVEGVLMRKLLARTVPRIG